MFRARFIALIALSGWVACAHAESNDATKMQFPDGTATPSEVCGACHRALYEEFSRGAGTDLHWAPMMPRPASKSLLHLPAADSRTATAHAVAGTDPWPHEARDTEENGKQCNVCHFNQPFDYPDLHARKIDNPKPREGARNLGITCASCHVTPQGKIRGPYVVDAPHETIADERAATSVACALCHSNGERIVGKQTQTFLEWRDDFLDAGLGKQQCQDCHMPRTLRKLAEDYDLPPRPVARHTWTGGHSFQRIASALNLAIVQKLEPAGQFEFHVSNVGAGHSVPTGSNRRAIYLEVEAVDAKGKVAARNEWMFAPWMLARADDRKYVEEDLKGPDPIATSQADAQGPHETIIRAGEERVLAWAPKLAKGRYTVRARLVYDLNRYNDRAFAGDQHEIGSATVAADIGNAPVAMRSQRE